MAAVVLSKLAGSFDGCDVSGLSLKTIEEGISIRELLDYTLVGYIAN